MPVLSARDGLQGFLIVAGSTIYVLYVEIEDMGRLIVTEGERPVAVQGEDPQHTIKINERARHRLIPAAVAVEL